MRRALWGRSAYCFGPMMGPSPITKYPAGGLPPFASANDRAASAWLLTASMFAWLWLLGTTTVLTLKPTWPPESVALTTIK
jgi:hypothetical protein